MFAAIERLAEERIREAMDRAEFDDLPGRGEPLELENDSHLPEDLRIAYKILKNADCLPPELQLRKEIHTTQQLLAGITDTQKKYKQLQKLNFLIMKLNMMRRVSPLLEEDQQERSYCRSYYRNTDRDYLENNTIPELLNL